MRDKAVFGPHLMLDLNQCNEHRLSDFNLVFDILNTLPQKIGMTMITPPYVFKYSGLVPEDKGITGFVVIAESHISIHTFQEKRFAFIDLFSCKPFDCEYVQRFLIEAFESKKPTVNMQIRGADFPREHQMSIRY